MKKNKTPQLVLAAIREWNRRIIIPYISTSASA